MRRASLRAGCENVGVEVKLNFVMSKNSLTFAIANPRKDAGVVDRGGLENRCAFWYPGFESLSFRYISMDYKPQARQRVRGFFHFGRFRFTASTFDIITERV